MRQINMNHVPLSDKILRSTPVGYYPRKIIPGIIRKSYKAGVTKAAISKSRLLSSKCKLKANINYY